MKTTQRNDDRFARFEAVCQGVAFFLIVVVSPAYGLWSLSNLPVI